MRIKSLTLHGFKSFPDRTKVELHEGITAVVGPNGCGKSNISDALRWVLGEQRPTAIRGSRMEEAIFGGTAERRPIHRAEVSLELSNDDGILPVPYSEVVIGRTVYRGGESEYSLNGSVCRLKDIHDLCRDTGLGANAYSIIESRMIDAILSDRAEERRALFEEAAEIGRYKDRRRTALRRLEQADGDLQRLDDVLGEVQSQVRSLAAQRGRAVRHVRLRERRLHLEVWVADARLASTREALERAAAELEELRSVQPAEEAALRTSETEAETSRIRIAERERDRRALARRLEETRQALEERDRRRLVTEERTTAARQRIVAITEELELLAVRRAELEAEEGEVVEAAEAAEAAAGELVSRERSLREEVEALDGRRRSAEAEQEAARARLEEAARALARLRAEREAAGERLSDRMAELERRRGSLEEMEEAAEGARNLLEEAAARAEAAAERESALADRLSAARGELEARREEARKLRDRAATGEGELSSLRAREASLSSFLASGEGLPPAVAALLEPGCGVPGVEGVLADCIAAPADVAGALEAHLGPYLHAVVVADWAAVEAAAAWLARRDDGEGLLLLPLDPGPSRPSEPSTGEAGAGGLRLLEAVELRGVGVPWARALLEGVALAPGGALRPESGPWVSPDGSGQDPRGAVRLGQPGAARGALRRPAELAALRERRGEAERALERVRSKLESAEAAAAASRTAADLLGRELEEAERARREAEGERQAVTERLERLAAERREAHRRIEELEASGEEARTRSAEDEERIAGLEAACGEAEEALSRTREETTAARGAWEAARSRLHALQLERAGREADLRAGRDRRERVERALRELREREERLRAERAEREEMVTRGHAVLEESEEVMTRLLEERASREAGLREADETLEGLRADLDARETQLRDARRVEREHAERRHALELQVAELRAGRASIRERLEAEWDASLSELRERVEPPAEGEPEEWAEELEEVRRGLARLGPVNLLAEEEYGQEKERLDFLLTQREDLVEARDSLRESIRRINRTAAEAFQGTFDQVRKNFVRTFHTLFEGGECDLWLDDPDDPLDSAIEISASPRGKRTQRIHLLSGGERALTALALLFAIYLAKPSPFCLMDEVDAPLDETNILRFVNMLERFKEETQFIIITHNPRTIESADWIYGVTMQEAGVSSVVGVTFGDLPEQVA